MQNATRATLETAVQRWLTIVGIGEDGWDGLNSEARQAIESADILFGGVRHLALVPAGAAPRIAWPSPMMLAVQELLTKHRGQQNIVVLASGDPMLHGVGVTLTRELARTEFRVIPQISAFSLVCARMGWPATETGLVSLVNRPIEQLHRHLYPDQRVVVFSEDGATPAAVARMLTSRGYGSSRMCVFESLGGTSEKVIEEAARSWSAERSSDLNAIALLCAADADSMPLSLVPGLPESVFESDGQLTKREVRAITLARLAPLPGQLLWDVGAGSGTIGIEWMRVHPSCSCIAFEERAERAERIQTNAKHLGVPALKVVMGSAPSSFAGMNVPHAIFIGGGLSKDMFEACWDRLASGGRLVANAVTVESEAMLSSLQKLYGGDLTRIQVARAEPVGGMLGWRPFMPITQWAVVKP
ncbi:precorrin-6Y C5,15-methyltransferase (decarboxylating) [Silvibacterium bohemicum]|uniref:Precorrin-6Y C5,15-methyltransferase (Decarboxylating) n=1 Tax=Silvibacterium bohemicum TaxID=1577686 RepID=A0A841JVG5_9BACT|nr:bifunctional cobalt-precorrin-7 (C(5))-methyltransferase/cobalt-precorrin-6B (C(15))-methyltransferase [Silvibacterium bohemicum]MBB6145336.1 precorrin-6Y C5,15-methyltransferase (decarboxylating) [Silvibacterium bohemicum]